MKQQERRQPRNSRAGINKPSSSAREGTRLRCPDDMLGGKVQPGRGLLSVRSIVGRVRDRSAAVTYTSQSAESEHRMLGEAPSRAATKVLGEPEEEFREASGRSGLGEQKHRAEGRNANNEYESIRKFAWSGELLGAL